MINEMILFNTDFNKFLHLYFIMNDKLNITDKKQNKVLSSLYYKN